MGRYLEGIKVMYVNRSLVKEFNDKNPPIKKFKVKFIVVTWVLIFITLAVPFQSALTP